MAGAPCVSGIANVAAPSPRAAETTRSGAVGFLGGDASAPPNPPAGQPGVTTAETGVRFSSAAPIGAR